MRGTILALMAATGAVATVNGASADEARVKWPSITYIGSAKADADRASFVPLGEPGVENMQVAAVGKKQRPAATPMVIRGGVVGSAFTGPPAPSVAIPTKDAKSTPEIPGQAPSQVNGSPAPGPDMANADPRMMPPPAGVDPRMAPQRARHPNNMRPPGSH
jgi:hypothetical protein